MIQLKRVMNFWKKTLKFNLKKFFFFKQKEHYVCERKQDLDIKVGLSKEEANLRKLNHYNNENNVKTTKSAWQIIKENIFSFFNMLYIAITIILCITKSWSNLTFLPIIAANIGISLFQEFKAKRTIEKLSLVSAPKANVIRDGELMEINTTDVVIDDAIKYSTGNQIITDSIVKEGFIEVNESMITGESDAISKKPGDMLYSGSFVVSGTCYAQVENVGKNNYIEKLAMEAKKQKDNKSELLKTLNWIIKVIGFIIIPFAIFQIWQGFQNLDINALAQSLEIGVNEITFMDKFSYVIPNVAGSVIGMIPSGLFLLTTVALAAGQVRLAKRNKTMVQEIYCIEMLARVDILCLDKTGTITDGSMRVIDCIELKNTTEYTLREIVGSMLNSFEETNATSEALIRFFDKNKVLKPNKIIPFSSQRKYSAVNFEDAGTFYLGAPEFVFHAENVAIKHKVEKYASQGCRVLLLTHTQSCPKDEVVPNSAKPIGMIVLQDHIRDDAFETLEYFRNNGVDIKVISGDNPLTVSDIAARAGIENAKRYKDINFIGIEKYDSVIVRAIQKSNELELDNLKIIRIDANKLDTIFDKEIDTIYLNFSDPWPKNRHEHRRLTSEKFLMRYDNLFNKEKHIIMKSDNRKLFEFSVISFTNYNYKIEEISLDMYNDDIKDNVQTEYERKFHSKGFPIYKIVVKK